ncbi:NAK/MPSK protein kinase [Spizellomyces punctatus DAOM BR117]|uniref:NAK/MPSK protein kinase n=1 Tax=Spizellomyces punctatus (strain DAOM BR117) TaxID=645134 RepID=A0A0L0HRT5_SPIPD|nr:NAK/MPSK protein kinase [Spizellomyces punctatus DAOM BR117]KND03802.1 NAK/MPSK protein kinase [Spizellomyces punctatus DAOM BR117]|eukprot:XP_016611841.1 NAK/MPSK protein kinase [Spizellomyces punctatus DAOM BR117]
MPAFQSLHISEPMGASSSRLSTPFLYFSAFLASIYTAFMSFFSRFKPSPVLTLNARRLRTVKPLGEGGFSFVYLVKDDAGSLFALKRVRVQLPEHEERLRKEIEAHKLVRSEHVVTLVDSMILKEGGSVVEGLLLLPFYEKGTVQDLIDRTPLNEFIPLKTILNLAVDVCAGLTAFHTQDPPLAFRDLKPANILISAEGHGVLMDLGSVSEARVKISSRREALALQELCAETATAPFRAPELFDPPSNGEIDERSDVWALGCTIYAMAYRNSPFDGSMTAAVSGRLSFPGRDPYGATFRALIESCTVTDWRVRPSISEVQERCRVLLETENGQV